jgi:hypothetical protein
MRQLIGTDNIDSVVAPRLPAALEADATLTRGSGAFFFRAMRRALHRAT